MYVSKKNQVAIAVSFFFCHETKEEAVRNTWPQREAAIAEGRQVAGRVIDNERGRVMPSTGKKQTKTLADPKTHSSDLLRDPMQ